jgi:isocitrate/isopropylmalate dehydrogenase
VTIAHKANVLPMTAGLFGDMLSDLTGQLCGSLGIAPSLNSSHTQAMAQAAHGAAPDIAGRGVANPIAMILSSAMLLRWLAERHTRDELRNAADATDAAVANVLDSGLFAPDLGGHASTNEFTTAVSKPSERSPAIAPAHMSKKNSSDSPQERVSFPSISPTVVSRGTAEQPRSQGPRSGEGA